MNSRVARYLTAILFALIPIHQVGAVEFMTEAERRAQYVEIEDSNNRKPALDQLHVASVSSQAAASHRNVHQIVTEPSQFSYAPGTIVVKTSSKTLHFIEADGSMTTFPIAVGRQGAQWFGTTQVTHKRKNPEWRPTPNMRKKNPKLPIVVRAGPRNPLGIRAIYLAEGYLRIHGTNEPKSIGKAASSGCYRMLNEHVAVLYDKVAAGAKVVVLR